MLSTFSQWLLEQTNEPIIYLDLDNTLIDSEEDGRFPGGTKIGDVFVYIRPLADEFLKNCKKLAPVYILTHGFTDYQKKIVDQFGWDVPVFGRDEYEHAKKSEKAVLVDNTPPDHPFTQLKIEAIGLTDFSRIILVPTWKSWDANDDALLHVLNQIQSILT